MMAMTFLYGIESMQIAQRCYLAGIAIWHIVCFCIGVLAVSSVVAAKGKFVKFLLGTMSLFVAMVFVAIAEYAQFFYSRQLAELFGKSFRCDELGRWAYPSWSPIAAVVAGGILCAILILWRDAKAGFSKDKGQNEFAQVYARSSSSSNKFSGLLLMAVLIVVLIYFLGPVVIYSPGELNSVFSADMAIWQICNLFVGVMLVRSIVSANGKHSKWLIAIPSLTVVTALMAISIEGQRACALVIVRIFGSHNFSPVYACYTVWAPIIAMIVGAAVSFAIIMIRRWRERRVSQSNSF